MEKEEEEEEKTFQAFESPVLVDPSISCSNPENVIRLSKLSPPPPHNNNSNNDTMQFKKKRMREITIAADLAKELIISAVAGMRGGF